MPYYETDNVWLVCLNCETEFSLEDLFIDEDDHTGTECSVCGSHSFRKSDGYEDDLYDSQTW